MTSTLNSITGLGHFLVVLHAPGERRELAQRLRRLRMEIAAGGKIPPVVDAVSSHALLAAWGGATISPGEGCTTVGIFQRVRNDGDCADEEALRRLCLANDPSQVNERALRGVNVSAVAVCHDEPRALAVTSPFRQLPLYRVCLDGMTAFATDTRLLVELGVAPREIDTEAVYHYLNYSCIPAPHCIFRGVRKIPAGTFLRATPGTAIEQPYWRPHFAGDRDGDMQALSDELRARIHDTVNAYRPDAGTPWGAFLSGGTDSSSITGILSRDGRETVRTYSIGFGEHGYDELEYARIAAARFRTQAKYRQVNEADTMAAIPKLLEAYDEPYGNASAVPTYYCALTAAADGSRILIAGDGGDEIFGGNERYAKDAIYRMYERVPSGMRQAVARALRGASLTGSLIENRVRHFARRGALANPERFYREESFASDHFDALLTPALRAAIARDSSLAIMQRHYDDCREGDALHRLMYVDLMMAIADNDLVKVQRASQAAGVSVAFPYLDPELVDFAGRLHSRWKVNGTRKRYLFKHALRDVLPAEIIAKKKQGFGLPIALWMRERGALRELTQDVLRSQHAQERGWFEPRFITDLLDTHDGGGWDMSPELWRLLMLELWQRGYVDAA